MIDPAEHYQTRLRASQERVSSLEKRQDRNGQIRLTLVLASLLICFGGWISGLFASTWGMLGFVPVFILFIVGQSLKSHRLQAERAVRYFQDALARVAGDWAGRGTSGEEFLDPNHPFAADLDLFGKGSLFERLCIARTKIGQSRLAGWLLTPSSKVEILSRQQAVRDLIPRHSFREMIALSVDRVESSDLTPLAAWATLPLKSIANWHRHAIFAMGWFNVLAVTAWLTGITPSLYLQIGLIVSFALAYPLLKWARETSRPVEAAVNDLPILETILQRLEHESFTSPRLQKWKLELTHGNSSPSKQVRELRNLGEWGLAKQNPMFLPVTILMMWDLRVAFRMDAWRQANGSIFAFWLDAVAELESLSSLAGYAFENPDDPFPEIHESIIPQFQTAGLGHPLLPRQKSVRNSFELGGDTAVSILVVSGSNMSGKSTLLRSVGINALLAMAGGPVRAEKLCMTPVQLGATMRVQDSLADGKSRFYAEVSRVRDVLKLAESSPPVMFLFDELFAGTNSSDRLAGAESVIQTMLDRGAIGFVTTHDLSLTHAVDRHGERAKNVHFSDQFINDELVFDYTMRTGIVPHGNGLAIMRAVGLKV